MLGVARQARRPVLAGTTTFGILRLDGRFLELNIMHCEKRKRKREKAARAQNHGVKENQENKNGNKS